MWMRPGFGVVPLTGSAAQVVGLVNSFWATPILRRTHSIGSYEPVEMAVSGMSPSLDLDGRLRSWGSAFAAQPFKIGNEYLRRHLPSWMTIGIVSPELALTGTLVSVKLPL